MNRLVLSALALLLPSVCLARIGETLDEVTARYGPMQKIENATGKFYSDYPQHCFTFQNILIRVRFLNGRSAQEIFYSSQFLDDYAKVQEIEAVNGKKQTGIDVVVQSEGRQVTITTKEFDALMKRELGSGGF
jgi:phosphoserine phosphatase